MKGYRKLSINQCRSIEDKVLETWKGRAQAQGYRGVELLRAQAEFLLGMVATLDVINDAEATGQSTISPRVMFGIMRGDYIE
jgi:hypothetical protein